MRLAFREVQEYSRGLVCLGCGWLVGALEEEEEEGVWGVMLLLLWKDFLVPPRTWRMVVECEKMM